jgi:hypothetical protein
MLETHGNSLLLQQDPSMANSANNMMNMSFTEGVTNKMNLGNSGTPELPDASFAAPLQRKSNRRRTVMGEEMDEKRERHRRSRRHSHSRHRSMRPEGVEGDRDRDREHRERRHSRRPDETEGERRERRHSRRPDETESERRERHRRSRRPITIIDENGLEKVVYKRRHHHHRSSRYVEGDSTVAGEERPEKPRSSHRHSRHRQSVAVGEQQRHHHSHSHLRSKHQSIAPTTASPSLDYSIGTTSFSLDTRSLNDVPTKPDNNSNSISNTNINTNPTNLPTQEINDFFDNIFKLNWSL